MNEHHPPARVLSSLRHSQREQWALPRRLVYSEQGAANGAIDHEQQLALEHMHELNRHGLRCVSTGDGFGALVTDAGTIHYLLYTMYYTTIH
jgi:hypothetical protein